MALTINEFQLKTEISDYLIDNLNRKVISRKHIAVPNIQHEAAYFDWELYISNFTGAIKSITSSPSLVQKTAYKSCTVHRSEGTEDFYGKEIQTAITKYMDQTDLFYHYDTGRKKHPQLHIFESGCIPAANCMIRQFLNRYQLAVNSYIPVNHEKCHCSNCSIDCGETIVGSAGQNDSFKKIGSSDFLVTARPTAMETFKTDYLEQMLDLRNPHICALLPYLLTAYVYNDTTNQFIHNGTTGPSLAFGSDSLSSSEATRIRQQLERLSHRFVFPDAPLSWKENMPDDDEPRVWYPNQTLGPRHNLPLLWRVFVVWCGALPHHKTSFIGEEVCAKIDFELCLNLFSSHTGFTPNYDPSDSCARDFLLNTYDSLFSMFDTPTSRADGQMDT